MNKILKATGKEMFKKDICIVEALIFIFICGFINPLLQLSGLSDTIVFFISLALVAITVWSCDKVGKKLNNEKQQQY